jgi:two-component system, NtrC family, response regulator HydG
MSGKLRILVVDDDRRMTHTLADILTLAGHEVVEATSGSDAILKAHTLVFDCVLSDVRMPGMNGLELYRELRIIQPGLPVVLMTAYAAENIIRHSLEEGVVAALEKPLDIQMLLDFYASMAKIRTITVVDNDTAFCQTLGDILELRGYQVKKVSENYTDAENIAADAQIILLDMKLNHVDGKDVMKVIREHYPDIPVVLITGYRLEMSSAIQLALDLNAHACLYKPLIIPELLQTIADVRLGQLRDIIKKR